MPAARLLKNINLFVDGRGYASRVDEFDPPKLTIKTEEFRAGGMDMPVEIDQGMEKLEATLTLSGIDSESLKLFGLTGGNFTPVTLRGGSEDVDTGAVEPAVIHLRGQFKEVDYGTWKPGEKVPVKLMVAARYYKLEVGGETIHEIDPQNMVRIIDGTDQMAAMRAALGL